MKYAKPKVIWLAGTDAARSGGLGAELQRLCRVHSIPAMLVDESRLLSEQGANGRTSKRLCRLAKELAEQGYPVIVTSSRQQESSLVWNRAHLPGYFEVDVTDESGGAGHVAPDMRIVGSEADRKALRMHAEAIFEEVFGRGQLLPCLNREVFMPGTVLQHSSALPG